MGVRLARAMMLFVFTVTLAFLPSKTVEAGLDADDNRTLTSGVALAGTIAPVGDFDTYFFNAVAGKRMTLSMYKTGTLTLDSYVSLYDTDGTTLLRFDDDSGGSKNALISNYTLPHTGQYKVVAKAFGDLSAGTYGIRVTLVTVDADDGRTLFNGVALAGTISPATDLDTYYFNSTAGKRISLSMYKTGASSVDSYLSLYDTNLTTLLRTDDDSGGNKNALIGSYILPHTGTYKVVARSFSGLTAGTYGIKLMLLSSDTDDGRTLTSGVALAGTINPITDTDTYFFNATAGQVMTLSMDKTGISTVDSYLSLYDTNLTTLLRFDDDSGAGLNALINSYMLPHTGQYKVVASSYLGDTGGAYAIQVSLGTTGGGAVNLALNKAASATSDAGTAYRPSMAVDGNLSTGWASMHRNSPQTERWLVDLGAAYTMDQVIVRWGPQYATQYYVGWANPPQGTSCWSTTFQGTVRNASSQMVDTIDFGDHSARCIGVFSGTPLPNVNSYSIYEVEVYDRYK